MATFERSYEKHQSRAMEELEGVDTEGSEAMRDHQYSFEELEKVKKGVDGLQVASTTTVMGSQSNGTFGTWSVCNILHK